jgi:transcriptional regulator with XRE-family HTH domain
MFFPSNIKLLRKRKKRTQDDVAFTLEIKRSTLSGYENGVALPSIPTLIDFSKYFGISIDTLVKVDLKQLSESQLYMVEHGDDVFLSGSRLRVLTTTVDNQEEVENIELVPEQAKAGYTRGFFDPEFIRELPAFNLPFLPREKKYRTFQISGDSMLPIPDGSWVTGEFVQDWRYLKDGENYIILTLNEGIVFKSIKNKIKEKGSLELISLNPFYSPYEIPITEVREIWKFVHYISTELPEGELNPTQISKSLNQLQKDVKSIKNKLLDT